MRELYGVHSHQKVLSDSATSEFVRQHCTPLVPTVVSYESTPAKPGDPDRSILKPIRGKPIVERWPNMSWEAKKELVKGVVQILAKLHDLPLSGIGNIYPKEDGKLTDMPISPPVKHTVAMAEFLDGTMNDYVSRGPYNSSHEWLAARLAYSLTDCVKILLRAPHIGEASRALHISRRLLALLPKFFPPPDSDEPERTVIYPDDLSLNNVYVDEDGKFTGIFDWQCVMAVPLWAACQLPAFLQTPDRKIRPEPNDPLPPPPVEGEDPYLAALREYEVTQLRPYFIEEMEKVQPEWVRIRRDPETMRKVDFDFAVQYCGPQRPEFKSIIERWVDHVEGMEDGRTQYFSLYGAVSS